MTKVCGRIAIYLCVCVCVCVCVRMFFDLRRSIHIRMRPGRGVRSRQNTHTFTRMTDCTISSFIRSRIALRCSYPLSFLLLHCLRPCDCCFMFYTRWCFIFIWHTSEKYKLDVHYFAKFILIFMRGQHVGQPVDA